MMRSGFSNFFCVLACLGLGAHAVRLAVEELGHEDSLEQAAVSAQNTTNYFTRLVERMKADPISVGLTLNGVLQGVQASVAAFQEDPPNYNEGFANIQIQMWEVIDLLAEPEFLETQEYADAQAAWNAGFGEVPEAVKTAADTFQETGDLTAFKTVADLAVNTSEDIAAAVFPELTPIFAAYGNLLRGISSAWVAYQNGETETAVELVWTSFNSSVVEMVGEERAATPEFQSTMKTMDAVVTTLITELVDFRKAKLESALCYRNSEGRSARNPTICENSQDWVYNGLATCYPQPWNGWDCTASCQNELNALCQFCPAQKQLCCKANDPEASPKCAEGTFVNYSYTFGNAEDYYQCVSEVFETLAEVHAEVKPQPKKPSDADVMEGLVARQKASLAQGRDASKMDSSFDWKCLIFFWRRSCRSDATPPGGDRSLYGSHPARCDTSSDFPTRIGSLCYGDCRDNWSPILDVDKETAECLPDCHGDFPAEGTLGFQAPIVWNVCGHSDAAITHANNGLLEIAANIAEAVQQAIVAIQQKGVAIESSLISNVITAFGDLAAAFNRPICGAE